MKPIISSTILIALFVARAEAASTVIVNWSNDRALTALDGIPHLSSGGPGAGDGALLQLGYFSMGTSVTPFAGDWIILATGSVGDDGIEQPGFFSITTVLESGRFMEPLVGTPLGIRFFDETSLAASSFYGTGINSDGSGNWVSPSESGVVIDLVLKKATASFEAGEFPFEARIPVPEPNCLLLSICGVLSIVSRRKRPCRLN